MNFVGRINAHDLDGLVSLMAKDHIFIDSLGNQSARPGIETGWRQYFEMVPDYWIRIDRMNVQGKGTVLIGAAGGTYVSKGGKPLAENRWETPAVWTAVIVNKKVAVWRIYSDDEPIRARMRESGPPD